MNCIDRHVTDFLQSDAFELGSPKETWSNIKQKSSLVAQIWSKSTRSLPATNMAPENG